MRTLALSIIGVGLATAILICASLHLIHDSEKMQRDPRLLRRRFLVMGAVYVVGSGWGIFEVARDNEPPEALIGIAVAASLAWLLIKQASKVDIGQ